jgi:hypothetical protein
MSVDAPFLAARIMSVDVWYRHDAGHEGSVSIIPAHIGESCLLMNFYGALYNDRLISRIISCILIYFHIAIRSFGAPIALYGKLRAEIM